MTAIPATFRLRREGALRSRAARGDAVAFAAVYERHHQALYRYCRSILRHEEDAQDALQNTFTRAFAALQEERRDFELRPWLFRIAHNEAISILRRRKATDELSDIADERPFEDTISDREELRLLQLDLADLPERQRAALVLRELNGLSHAEIGVVLELSPGAVKQAIFEARSALFSCREGREMECHDVRRMLSDGDGRVLRGRGLRAHLRSCPDCSRFKADLAQRPRALKALVPPMPVGAAAALLGELLGVGTAAKLLACAAIVGGGGATLAVELRDARGPAPPPAVAEATPKPERDPKPPPVAVPAVATSEPQPAEDAGVSPRAETREGTPRRERPRRERPRRARPRPAATPSATPQASPQPAPARDRDAAQPEAAKPEKPVKTPKPTPPGQAKTKKPKPEQAAGPKPKPTPAPPPAASATPAPKQPDQAERAGGGPGRGEAMREERANDGNNGNNGKARGDEDDD
jgi:RNA polymerase sigma factor (sigma-70 family)